jgi:glycosyltransferase involved in cell wall biosynthesis
MTTLLGCIETPNGKIDVKWFIWVGIHSMELTVSIGLPVCNGQNYLGDAIGSILAQDFTDFELIISDNASTDATQDIARGFAARDSRVRYHRNPKNLGPEANFNKAFQLARGRYFKWAAHDDLVEPGFLGKCVSLLEADPGVVLCQSVVRIIDQNDEEIGVYDGAVGGAASPDCADRFRALVMVRHLCTELFGVIRSDALRKTRLLDLYYGADRALLLELAMLGRFAQVPEVLFSNREHEERCSRAVFRSTLAHAGYSVASPVLPTWALYRDYRRAVNKHVGNTRDRRSCLRTMRRWWITDWNVARLVVDMIATVYPDIVALVYRLKVRFYGSLPQLDDGKRQMT